MVLRPLPVLQLWAASAGRHGARVYGAGADFRPTKSGIGGGAGFGAGAPGLWMPGAGTPGAGAFGAGADADTGVPIGSWAGLASGAGAGSSGVILDPYVQAGFGKL